MRQVWDQAEFQAPEVDISTDDGLQVSGSLGGVQLGDTAIMGPRANLRAGQWHDEHGLQTGVSLSGSAGHASAPGEERGILEGTTRAGAFEDEDGLMAGFDTHGEVVDMRSGDHRVAIGSVQSRTGLFEAERGGMSFGTQNDLVLATHGDESATQNLLHLSGDAWAGQTAFEVGGSANLFDISVGEMGTSPRAVDHGIAVGMSEGVGAAIRGSWQDGDGDGLPERRVGFEVGPAALELMTEDPENVYGDSTPAEIRRAAATPAGPPANNRPGPARPVAGPADMVEPTPHIEPVRTGTMEDDVQALTRATMRQSTEFSSFDREGRRQYDQAAISHRLRVYQRQHGLEPTGTFDTATRAALQGG